MSQFVFSTSVDGKIKAWLYDNLGSRVDYDAPGRSCTTMLYSADSKRLICYSILILQPVPVFWETQIFNLYIKRNAGSFHVGQTKMENLMLLSGMNMKA